jgi:signal peptidase
VARAVLGWAAVVVLVLLLWPQRFGGHLGVTQVSGHSMDGTYATGDLLLSWRTGTYDVGDVIVYHPPGVDTSVSVVHRIVDEPTPGRYLTRGDNKTDADPWQPQPADVEGAVFLRVPTGEIPGLGNVRGLTLILLVGFLAAWAAAAFVMAWGRTDSEDPPDAPESEPRELELAGAVISAGTPSSFLHDHRPEVGSAGALSSLLHDHREGVGSAGASSGPRDVGAS